MGVRSTVLGIVLAAIAAASASAAVSRNPVALFVTPDGFTDVSLDAIGTAAGFIVAWDRVNGSDATTQVLARRFSARGAPAGPVIVIDPASANSSARPKFLDVGGGRLLVTWLHEDKIQGAFLEPGANSIGASKIIGVAEFRASVHFVAPVTSGYALISREANGPKKENTVVTFLDPNLNLVGKSRVIEKDKPTNESGFIIPSVEQNIVAHDGGAVAIYRGADDQTHGVPFSPRRKPGEDFTVNTTPGYRLTPFELFGTSVQTLALPNGGYVVAWAARRAAGDDQQFIFDVRARVFDARGRPTGDDFRVNPKAKDTQFNQSLALTNGGFVVGYYGGDPSGTDARTFVRFFSQVGEPQSGEIVTERFGEGQALPLPNAFAPLARLVDGSFVSVFGSGGTIYADGVVDASN